MLGTESSSKLDTDLRQSLKTTQRDVTPDENITHINRPKKNHEKATKTHRVNELYPDKEQRKFI